MEKKYKFLLLIIILILIALAWSPWLNDKFIHNKILIEKGTIGSGNTVLCDYSVIFVPFGRWVASCEGGYFVTFYGSVL